MASLTRHVLEGVPPTYFHHGYPPGRTCGDPESLALPSCLRAWLEFVGDSYGCKFRRKAPTEEWRPDCAYTYLEGLMGGGFSLGWNLPEGLDRLSNPLLMAEDPVEPFHRVLDAIGYEHEILLAPDLVCTATGKEPASSAAWDETEVRARILASLRAGRPAIGLGLVGPPEACLITGYDEGGAVLTGWSLFQKLPEFAEGLELEPCGYLRVRDWFPNLHGLVVIGERKEKPPARETHRSALEWAVQVMRTPEVHGRPSGLAAYAAWREALREEGRYPPSDEAALRRQWRLHNDITGFLASERHHGRSFLLQLISYSPELEPDLRPAADSCGIQHDLMWGVWEYLRSWDPGEHHQRLTDGWLRERMCMLIDLARREDANVVAQIERALEKEW